MDGDSDSDDFCTKTLPFPDLLAHGQKRINLRRPFRNLKEKILNLSDQSQRK